MRKTSRFNVFWSLKSLRLSLQVLNVEAVESAKTNNQRMELMLLRVKLSETSTKTELTYPSTRFFTQRIL